MRSTSQLHNITFHYILCSRVQARMKATFQRPMPEATDSTQQQPVFGVHDASAEKWREEKERIQAYFLEQLKMASEKQRRMKEEARREQQEEEMMLNKT